MSIIYKDIPYINDENSLHTLDISLPEDGDIKSAFIYIHGGGIESGEKEFPCGGFLEENGIAIFANNYRMYHDAKYPEFIEDCASAVSWVFNNAEKYGIPKDKIFIGGSSAGGYISAMLCFDGKYLKKHGISVTDIAGFIHDAGQMSTHFNVLRERGIPDGTRRVIVDEAAPLFHIGLSEKYPPMMFFASDNDMPNRIEQILLSVSTLNHFGHEKAEYKIMENTHHCSYDHDRSFGEIILDFIKKYM